MPFVHLHNHTLFSMLDGIASPENYFQACADRKWPAFAVTEHGVLNSIPDCYFASKETGVKFIPGCEFYYCDLEPFRRRIIEEGGKVSDLKIKVPGIYDRIRKNRHLTILCKNQEGYQNVLKMNMIAWEQGFYYRPRIWMDLLEQHSKGLIILSGCLNGPVSRELLAGNLKSRGIITGARDYVKKFKKIFKDDFYVELQMPNINIGTDETPIHDSIIFEGLTKLADEFKIKTIITADCHYLNRDDYEIQKVMMAIDQNLAIDDPSLFHSNSNEQYLKSREQLRQTFDNELYHNVFDSNSFEKSCDNTLEVADKCESFKPDLGPKLPVIKNEDFANKELIRLTLKGLQEKGLDKDDKKYLTMDGLKVTYKEQMMIELERFITKGFASYFLIMRDLVLHSTKTLNWPIGPGRGSAGGSLVCYLLGIHYLDPIKIGLSFDRMLSASRGGWMLDVAMPKE